MPLPARAACLCAASALVLLGACRKTPVPATAEPAGEWPASLHVFGPGFPNAGDPCRNVGESEATANLLDHTAWLVGCRSETEAAKLGGKIVATVDGVTLVSIPR